MSDQYYDHERMPAENDQEEVNALSTQLAALPKWDEAVQPLMMETEQYLGTVYEQADQRDDEDTKALVAASWERQQTIAEQGRRANATAHVAAALAVKMNQKAQQALSELKELTDAVEEMDTDHPLVADLIDAVSENEGEYFATWGREMMLDGMIEDAIYSGGMDANTACTMLNILTGDEPEVENLDGLIAALTKMRERIYTTTLENAS